VSIVTFISVTRQNRS